MSETKTTTELVAGKGVVVIADYRLLDVDGACLEQSEASNPMVYLHGYRNLMSGLESALEGKKVGDDVSVTLPPEQSYGLRRDNAVERIPVKYLIKPPKKLLAGMRVQVNTKSGPRDATVVKAGRFNVDIDGNHPYAGKSVTFELKITRIREATREELSHGHPHGPDGTAGHHH